MKLPKPPSLNDLPAPPGPFRPGFWRSPLRGPWLTSFLGSLLLPLLTICALTGLLSHLAYSQQFASNQLVPDAPLGIGLPDVVWPTAPAWLYALTQGLHVISGLMAVPLLLAKLWSAMPKFFEWPPAVSVGHALERLSLAGLVGGGLLVFVTGILNIQLFYPWAFSFVPVHVYAAIIFTASLVLHVSLKMPLVIRSFRERGFVRPLRDDLAHTEPEPYDPNTSAPAAPRRPTISRRGFLGTVGAASGLLGLMSAAQVIGGPLRPLGLLAPHGSEPTGAATPPNAANDFQINKTAAYVGLGPEELGAERWSLELEGGEAMTLSREDLEGLEQHTETLPIACVEGWSTTQDWTGVRLADLAELAGAPGASAVYVESVQEDGPFRAVTLGANVISDERSLLALSVNGAALSADHGYPARIIAPALPGVQCTKWVGRMSFEVAS